jgi:hypothetical protein
LCSLATAATVPRHANNSPRAQAVPAASTTISIQKRLVFMRLVFISLGCVSLSCMTVSLASAGMVVGRACLTGTWLRLRSCASLGGGAHPHTGFRAPSAENGHGKGCNWDASWRRKTRNFSKFVIRNAKTARVGDRWAVRGMQKVPGGCELGGCGVVFYIQVSVESQCANRGRLVFDSTFVDGQ